MGLDWNERSRDKLVTVDIEIEKGVCVRVCVNASCWEVLGPLIALK